jgi:anaerobic selenocysteine-containing dehydrogenase
VAAVKGGHIVDVQGDEEHPISRGRLCARGSAFVQGLTLPERLTAPATRKKRGDAFKPLEDWKIGIDLLAERLRQAKEKHGPDSLLIGCDLEGGLDFQLGAMRFAQLWGTSQVFHAVGEPLERWSDGLDSPAASCSDWIQSRCLLLVEADLAATHPVAFSWVQDAQRRGAKVVAADARFTATLAKADLNLRIKPGQGNLLGLALMKLILAEGGQNAQAVEAGFTDAADWQASFGQMTLDGAQAVLGIPLEKLQHVARLLMQSGPVTLITGRSLANAPHHRIWLTLATAMGWTGRPGGGWYPVEAGTPPFRAQASATEASAAPASPPASPKLADVTARGDLQAIICSGNCLSDYLSPFHLAEQVELIAHFGSFPNATWAAASMTFPAALWAERDGLAVSNDRAIQWGAKIVEPPVNCRTGLDFWMELARRFGWETQFPWAKEDGRADHAAFYTWLLAQSPSTAKLQVEHLQSLEPGSQIFWPVGENVLPDARLPFKGKVAPHPAPAALASASETAATADFPFAFQTTHVSSRSGDASHFWPWTRGLAREDAVQINPETAGLLGIQNGDEVLIDTPQGTLPGRACLSRMVPRWLVAASKGVNGIPALVHKKSQPLDEARKLLKELT